MSQCNLLFGRHAWTTSDEYQLIYSGLEVVEKFTYFLKRYILFWKVGINQSIQYFMLNGFQQWWNTSKNKMSKSLNICSRTACMCVCVSQYSVRFFLLRRASGFCFLKHVGQMLAYDVASCLHSS